MVNHSATTAGERPLAAQRWYIKKAARAGISALTAPIVLAGVLDRQPGVRVLTYHRFGPDVRAPFTVSAEVFDQQMAAISTNRIAVSLDDVRAFLAGKTTVPKNAVLVTIDDGDPSVLSIALPILQKYQIPAVAFVLAGSPRGFAVMSGPELRALAAGGVDIGSHSVSHASLARLSPEKMQYEARESRRRLEDIIGRSVTSFAYPYGTMRDFSEAAAETLKEAGYDLAFTSQHGPVRRGINPQMLPRVKVESGDPDWHFKLLCRGGMDAWRIVDSTLSQVQRPA